MRLRLHSTIAAGLDRVWDQARDPSMMNAVANPLARFSALAPFPRRWREGDYPVRVLAGGLVPLGTQVIRIELSAGDPVRQLRDNGYGISGLMARITRWDHRLEVCPDPRAPTRTLQRDTVDIKAGWLTLPVWLTVGLLFLWRQARWRRLAARRE